MIMKKTSVLHLLTPAKNASPFDVNMAFDSGFEKIMPYTEVTQDEISGLTQDVIFSRSPSGVKQTGIFIGGRDIDVAMDMMKASKKSMFGPFTCSVFADPSGAFTTGGAMIAKVEFHLKKQFGEELTGQRVSVFGATGPVGGCVSIIAAQNGAKVTLVAHNERALEEAKAKVEGWNKAYDVELTVVLGGSDEQKTEILKNTDIVLSAAAAGIQIISQEMIKAAGHLKVLADVNAVAPAGIEGVAVDSDGVLLKGTETFGIGALAVGQLKYGTQLSLLQKMLSEEKPQVLDFLSAFALARELLAAANATTYATES
jgi:methylene-tetrahydromethanopterin dehydrogenase